MPKPDWPHLNRDKDRHGNIRYYVRIRHGRKIRIKQPYMSPAFVEEYKAAVLQSPVVPPSTKKKKGTLAWLVARWKEHSDWLAQAEATRSQRENILEHVLEKSGHRDYTDITKADIKQGKEDRKATPFAANNFLKTMSAIFRWAVEEGLLESNPAEGVPHFKKEKGHVGHKPWTLEDVERYRAFYPLGTRERLALEILINTGLRRGDLVRVGDDNVARNVIAIRTEKTGVQLYIPLLPKLEEALKVTKTGQKWICDKRNGKPISKEGFGTLFREWCIAAGVTKRAHGLRKLCATIVADDGASELELQALFGWLTNNQSAIYTAESNKKRLALQAAMRLIEEEDDEEEDEPLRRTG